MAFVIGKIETVKRKVQFDLPADEGKRPEKAFFTAELKVRDVDTIKARAKESQDYILHVQREVGKLSKDPDYEADIPEEDFKEKYLREDLVNITDCLDANGDEVPFSDDLLEAILQDRAARGALVKVWDELNLSPDAVKRKN